MTRSLCLAAVAATLMGYGIAAQAAGVELAVGQTGESTMTYRLGLKVDWDKSWWLDDVGRLTGYWSGAYTYWEGDETAANNSLSISPVLVYEFSSPSIKPYIELGVGVALFSDTKIENNNLGSAFQFEDRFGVGVRFAGGHEVGVRATHYSNAGITRNNDGVESYAFHYTVPL
jgi:lipid A 3-O-deacylase